LVTFKTQYMGVNYPGCLDDARLYLSDRALVI